MYGEAPRGANFSEYRSASTVLRERHATPRHRTGGDFDRMQRILECPPQRMYPIVG
jgi:hypothetical protein